MPYDPEKINRGATEISASGWNSFVRLYNDYYKTPGSFIEGSPILRSSTIVDVVLDDGAEDIKPYQPCRIVKSGKFIQETGSMWFVVEPVDRVDGERHGNYAFTLAEGVTAKGGRAVIDGLAIVTVTRSQARDIYEDAGMFNEGKYDSSYYIVPDETLSSNTDKVIGPVGHFRFCSWYSPDDIEKQYPLLADDLLMVIDLNQRPTSFLAKVDATIAASTEDSEVITMSSGTAYAYYGVSESTAATGDMEVQKDEDAYEIEVYNPSNRTPATGRVTVQYSEVYNCFFFVTSSTGTFQIEMTQVGGEQGTSTNPASWTYDVKVWEGDGSILKAGVDPVASPSHYRRPNAGQLDKATFGTATYNLAGELVIIDCNETLKFTTC
jgi:hypothetical protein